MSVLFWPLVICIVFVCAVFAFMAASSFWVSHRILSRLARMDAERLAMMVEMQRPPKERET